MERALKLFTRHFLRGLFTLLPIALSLYVLVWFFTWAERFINQFLFLLLPETSYVPGMGIVLGILAVFLVGVMMSSLRIQKIFTKVEMPFNKVPLVKSIYAAIKDLMSYFSPQGKGKANQVVVLKVPGWPVEAIGFLTRSEMKGLPEGVTKRGQVAVYIPLSYQIGGTTIFVPKEWVKPVDMSVEEAMRSALTAWMPSDKGSQS